MSTPHERVFCAACGEVQFRFPYQLRTNKLFVCDNDCLQEARKMGLVRCGGQKPRRPDRNGKRWCPVCEKWQPIEEFSKDVTRECRAARAMRSREQRAASKLKAMWA